MNDYIFEVADYQTNQTWFSFATCLHVTNCAENHTQPHLNYQGDPEGPG